MCTSPHLPAVPLGPPGCIPDEWAKQHYPHVGRVTVEHACGHQIFGGVPPPPPRQGRRCGSRTCGALSRLVDYTQEGSTTAVPGFQARRQGPEPIPGTYEPNPVLCSTVLK